jgi:hypothetical protein
VVQLTHDGVATRPITESTKARKSLTTSPAWAVLEVGPALSVSDPVSCGRETGLEQSLLSWFQVLGRAARTFTSSGTALGCAPLNRSWFRLSYASGGIAAYTFGDMEEDSRNPCFEPRCQRARFSFRTVV